MKTVVLTKPKSQVIGIEGVNHVKYYGMLYRECRKAFLTRREYLTEEKGGGFYWLCCHDVNLGNRMMGGTIYNSAKEAVEAVLNVKYSVFEFDSDRELFKWLAE